MEIGLNLSFAVKRWMTPRSLGDLVGSIHDQYGVSRYQFSFDQLDPWWPAKKRDALAQNYREELEGNGLKIDSAFGGLAAYTFPNLLAPLREQRESGLELFKRSLDTTIALGATVYGSPLGGMDAAEAQDETLRKLRYQEAVEAYHSLAEYAAQVGVTELMVEPTPVDKELLFTPETCLQFAKDVADAAVPVTFLVDWGHAVCAPHGSLESMAVWLNSLGANVGALHLQQTDGVSDRHWAFDREGLITNEVIQQVAANTGTQDLVQYLEYMPLFEDDDASVLASVRTSLEYLSESFSV